MNIRYNLILTHFTLVFLTANNIGFAQPEVEWIRLYRANERRGDVFYDVAWTGNHRVPGFVATGIGSTGEVDRWGYGARGHWLLVTNRAGDVLINTTYRDIDLPAF